jgi:hypothetical protein
VRGEVIPIRDARSLDIATAWRKPTVPVDASPDDPHRNHFFSTYV